VKLTLSIELESPEELARVAEAINFAAPAIDGAISAAERAAGVTPIGDAPKRRGRPPKNPQGTVTTAPEGPATSSTTTSEQAVAAGATVTPAPAPAPAPVADSGSLFDEPAPVAAKPTRDDVKAALLAAKARVDATGKDGKAAAFGLLQKNGAASLQALAEDKYATVISEANAL
jgi:hypothetical protein